MRILGISAFYHDSAAALLENGVITAAAQEERFTRTKHDARFPSHAIAYCLEQAGTKLSDIDHIAFYDKPFLKFERLLETYVATAPRGFASFRLAIPVWLREKLFQKDLLRKELRKIDPDVSKTVDILFSEHHLSHAASAFFPSPFDKACVLTLDGVGEWATSSCAIGNGNELNVIKEINFPHSLGLLYSAFTYYAGFRVNSGEYKLMGLAPYGEPKYAGKIRDHVIDIKPDGSYRMDMDYFNYATGLTMTSAKFHDLFGREPRAPETPLEQFHMDIAASIQAVTEDIILAMARALARETRETNLCLAGGVALNCVANGKLVRDGAFENVWIQPAAGDAGGALGAALVAHHLQNEQPRNPITKAKDAMSGTYLGPEFSQSEIETQLSAAGAKFTTLSRKKTIETTAKALADGKAVGWFQGRMEFGPRALGARSILGDPRSPKTQKTLNLKVKYRESFRPFAPSILADKAGDWFELKGDSPYMLLVADVAKKHRKTMSKKQRALFGIDKLNVARSSVPAITHVDYSARVQTVHKSTNAAYHALITQFDRLTGCPMLVNTSFNVRGEPIVCTPEDAFHCFMGTELDLLIVGNCVLAKQDQDPGLKRDYKESFELD